MNDVTRARRVAYMRAAIAAPAPPYDGPPTLPDLLAGAEFLGFDALHDARSWAATLLREPRSVPESLRLPLSELEREPTLTNLRRLSGATAILTTPLDVPLAERAFAEDVRDRVWFYEWMLGDCLAAGRAAGLAFLEIGEHSDDWTRYRCAVTVLEALDDALRTEVPTAYRPRSREAGRETAASELYGLANVVEMHREATSRLSDADKDALVALAEIASDIAEDRAGIVRVEPEPDPEPKPPAMVVLRQIGVASSEGSKIKTQFAAILDKPVRLVERPAGVPGVRDRLLARHPHARVVLDALLTDVAQSPTVRIRPTLLVGSPGAGKSTLLQDVCETLRLPNRLVPCGGIMDGMIAGVSKGWSTGMPSVPVDLILLGVRANPALILDEIEKTGQSRHNGNLPDAVLSMLEPATSHRYVDPYLQAPVDLSAVVWLATANSLDGLQPAFRDRFRILTMPEPGLEHLAALLPGILAGLTKRRGLSSEWTPVLAPEDVEAVAELWRGGSLRRLTRIVDAVVSRVERRFAH